LVGKYTGVALLLGAAGGGGLAGTVAAGFVSVADGGTVVVAGGLEHAAERLRSIAMTRRLLIAASFPD
jgi:hypothetical protein